MVAIKQVIEAYVARGFKIWHIYADGQFEHAGKHIKNMGIMLNMPRQTCPRNRKNHQDSKRKSAGYSQHIVF